MFFAAYLDLAGGGRKVDKVLFFMYKDWWQSYRGRSSEVWKMVVFALEKEEWQTKTPFFEATMSSFAPNVIFGQKKSACGKPPAEENCVFPRERHFWAKKCACGKPPVGGKWFWSFLLKKKRRLRQAASWRKIVFFPEKRYFGQKKGACGKPPVGGNFFGQKLRV